MKLSLSMIALFFLLWIQACSETQSKPTYKFKKGSSDGVVARYGDIVVKEDDLLKGLESDLYEQEKKIFDLKFDRVKTLIIEKIIDADPKKGSLSYDEYMDKFIANSIKITDQEIQNFINEKKIPPQHINDGIKDRIRQFLMGDKKLAAVDEWLAKKTGGKEIEVFFEAPRRPSFDIELGDSPSFGPKDAKVTIVEFSDFQCPFCSKGAELVNQLKAKYGSKIQVVFKNFPLPFHKEAKLAATAGLCAKEQKADAFWSMHDKMFQNQDKLKAENLKSFAKELKLNETQFNECLDSNRLMVNVEKDLAQGEKVGVKSTPTFYVNGMLVQGAQPIEVFSELIDSELKR